MRLIVLDTETTGMNKSGNDVCQDHRIIEIGCVELIDDVITGKQFHRYINPGRKVDPKAFDVHGIDDDFLVDKPDFEDIAEDFLDFIGTSDLIIHNAPFDVAFLNKEFRMLSSNMQPHGWRFRVFDTLALARALFPGMNNTLDALCARYSIPNGMKHGALVDAVRLARVYLELQNELNRRV